MNLQWVDWHEPDASAVAGLLATYHRELGQEPIQVTAEEMAGCTRSGGVIRLGGSSGTVGIAAVLPDDMAILGVSRHVPGRARVLAEALAWLAARVGAGALWLPDGDDEAASSARQAGFALQYTDIQMTLPVTDTGAPEPPPGYITVELGTDDASDLRAVHDLVCRTWSVTPHWPAFETRFAAAGADPSLWVLLSPASDASAETLAAAAWGSIRPAGDSRVGEVSHLNVDPHHRRRGLGPWALSEVVRRFGLADPQVRVAQLGVHDDNASHAPALYHRLGWNEISRHQKWALPT